MSALLDALGYASESLGKPGAAVRGLLGGQGVGALANLIPFSDTMGITDPRERVSGRDLLQQAGLVDKDTGLGGDVAGVGVDIATDPLTYLGGALASGLGLSLKHARLAKAIQEATAAKALPEAANVARAAMPGIPEAANAARAAAPGLTQTVAQNLPDLAPKIAEATANAPAFYSRLERAIQGLPENPKTQSVMNMIKKAGVSDEELQYSELGNALKEQGERTPKAALLEQYNQDPLRVDPKVIPGGRYQDYSIPGGQNYQEHLLTLPDTGRGVYESPHFEDPNIIAHLRTQEFKTPEGKPFLHADEIQSDWHQAGKESGYATPEIKAKQDAIEKAYHDAYDKYDKTDAAYSDFLRSNRANKGTPEYDATLKEWQQQFKQAREDRNMAHRAYLDMRGNDPPVPDAPFKEAWPELAMKHLLRTAAERDMDRVTWNRGQMIQNLVGGDLGGQQKFYDEVLPNIAKKLGKPYGASPETYRMAPQALLQSGATPDASLAETLQGMANLSGRSVHSMAITPAMKEAILKKGFPLLSAGLAGAGATGGGNALLDALTRGPQE